MTDQNERGQLVILRPGQVDAEDVASLLVDLLGRVGEDPTVWVKQVGQPLLPLLSLLQTCFAEVGWWVSQADGFVLKILLVAGSTSALSGPGLGARPSGRLDTVLRAAAPLRPRPQYSWK